MPSYEIMIQSITGESNSSLSERAERACDCVPPTAGWGGHRRCYYLGSYREVSKTFSSRSQLLERNQRLLNRPAPGILGPRALELLTERIAGPVSYFDQVIFNMHILGLRCTI